MSKGGIARVFATAFDLGRHIRDQSCSGGHAGPDRARGPLSGEAKRGGLAPGAGRVTSAKSTALPSPGAWKASRRKLVADKPGASLPRFRSRTKFRIEMIGMRQAGSR